MADLIPQKWASLILHRLGIHQTPGAVQALAGWARAEGGHWHNDARYNPLNTTQPEPGAGNTGTQGNIKVYRSWQQGVKGTVDTLRNGRYGGILQALQTGDPARVADAIGRSPWGTSAGLARSAILGTPRVAGVQPLSAGGSAGPSPSPSSAPATRTIPGVDRSQERRALILNFLQQRHQPGAVVNLATGLQGAKDTPSRTVSTGAPASPRASTASTPASSRSGTANFEGTTVAAWIKPELEYARQHGWKGTVNSGFRSLAEQTAIYNSGRRPAAKPGTSNHEGADFPRGAVDVSDPQTLARILRRKGSPLVWAGGKDPVHFSHPHGGSY